MINYIKEHKIETFFIFFISFFAFVLRLIALQNFGDLWVDELYSKYFANQGNVFDITRALFKEDFHVPLYFVLLNYWTKIFGDTPIVMRLMGVIISTITIPASYFIVKDLFKSKLSAVFVSLLLAISAFNIHYSVELRFYGISILLALLSTFFFVKIAQNINNKNIIWYSVFTLLLLYTYNFSFMYVFCQFIVGAIYFIKNKKDISKFLSIYLLVGILYLPVILMILHNFLIYQSSILQFVRDIFAFDVSCFFTVLMTIYTNCFEQFMTNDIYRNYYYLKLLFTSIKGFTCFLLPISIGVFGFVMALKSKNKDLKLFVYPSIMLLMIQMFLVFSHTLAFVLRYTIISTTLILITSIVGLGLQSQQNKKNKILISLCSLWFIINLIFLFTAEKYSVMSRNIVYTQNLSNSVQQLNIKSDDYIFIPRFGKLLENNVPQGKHIDIDTYDALFLGNRPQDIEFIFGKELSTKLNRKMAKTYLYNYLAYDEPLEYLHKNLTDLYFSKMHKGQRFIIITDETLDNLKSNQAWFKNDINVYSRSAIYYTLSAKILSDSINFAKQDLNYKQHIRPSNMFDIYIFEK